MHLPGYLSSYRNYGPIYLSGLHKDTEYSYNKISKNITYQLLQLQMYIQYISSIAYNTH